MFQQLYINMLTGKRTIQELNPLNDSLRSTMFGISRKKNYPSDTFAYKTSRIFFYFKGSSTQLIISEYQGLGERSDLNHRTYRH